MVLWRVGRLAAALCIVGGLVRTGWCGDEGKGAEVELPLIVYDECENEVDGPFAPTGWMGQQDSIKRDACWTENPHGGSSCIRIDFEALGWWAGIAWQHPANDWGDLPGGYDLSKARKLIFWARGEKGGEEVEFKYAVLGSDKTYPDSSEGKAKKVRLTKDWKEYRINLSGRRERIKTGFVWTVPVTDENMTFYLDDIRYE